MRRILALLICLCMALLFGLSAFAASGVLEEIDWNDTLFLECQPLPEELLPWFYADEAISTDISGNAIELVYGENIIGINLYYKSGNNWVNITESDLEKLPVDAEYQFEILYNNISIDDLIAADGQMVYRGVPDWFLSSGKSVILYGDSIVAMVEESDGVIVVNFDLDWLEEHKGKSLSGPCKISGKFDWHSIPEDEEDRKIPGLDKTLEFEDDLAQKYGIISLDKSSPEIEKGEDGNYYLKYTLTVTNDDSVVMPDITVRDAFATVAYIEAYFGVDSTERELPNFESDDLSPWESSSWEGTVAGTLSADNGNMLWNIGELQPGETRILTYYAKIDESYVSNIINNPIINRAEAYSGEILKDIDTEAFTPKNDVKLEKDHHKVEIGPNGTGTISYTLTITAPEDNTFTLDGLTLKDTFPEELKAYLSGTTDGSITVTVKKELQEDSREEEQETEYSDGSFELNGLDIAPGETITITYTIHVTNVFLASNDQLYLTNTATVSKGERSLRGVQDTVVLEKQTWTRKIAGDPLEDDITVEIPDDDKVYEYNGNDIVKEEAHDAEFEVPDGSIRYQIVLNESGQWDLSSTSMTDQFSNDYLKYVGYVQIQLFERAEGASNDLSDQDLIAELEGSGSQLIKTVWLKIDERGNFTFHPEDLGLPKGNYTYLLTYYAEPQNMDDVGSVQVGNSFKIEGTVGVGDGTVDLPAIEVSVGKIIQGGVKYDAEKVSWYYDPSPVLIAEGYDESIFSKDYENGAIYWVIRLDGDIGAGEITDKGKWKVPPTIDGFYINDKPDAGHKFNRDAVVGIYVGDKGFDFTSYSSYSDFLVEYENKTLSEKLEKLNGNPINQKYFDTTVTNPDYEWCSENSELECLTFAKKFINDKDKYDKNTQSIYIVLRTTPTSELPTKKNDPRIFKNDLRLGSGDNLILADDAEYTYVIYSSLLKESKGAYIFDKEAETFENCSNRQGGDWDPGKLVQKDLLPTSGIYATWLLNVNYNGSMDGTYDIVDRLPEGLELVYVDVNNFGNAVKKIPEMHPKTEYVHELSSDPDWTELETESLDDIKNPVKTITYYNKSTRKILWHISNFTDNSDGRGVRREINLRIICKVVDPELVLNQEKTYENNADVLDPNDPNNILETTAADVTIYMKLGKDWDFETLRKIGGVDDKGEIIWPLSVNQLPFKIDVNPLGEDLCNGDTLPPLIDLLSNLELIESSLEVRILDGSADGIPYTGFTYDVSEIDGKQALVIYGLPNGMALRITYKARITAKPKETVNISNEAYWAGYDPPRTPQIDDEGSYMPSSDVFLWENITVTITKVDADSHSKKLDGAEFELYKVDSDTFEETLIRDRVSSDSMGNAAFDNKGGIEFEGLEFDTVYCIKEVTAPYGYELDKTANCYYFIIVEPNSALTDDDLVALKEKYSDLDVWYDSPDYTIVIENRKGSISVNKVFVDANGEEFIPTSGRYRFGLFNGAGDLLEILTIEYIDGDVNYYLDDIPKESPRFTKYDPETVYQVYELDANGNPIKAGLGESSYVTINDVHYRVIYSSETPPDRVTVNSSVKITNAIMETFELPFTGGKGSTGYYISGCILVFIAMLSCLLMLQGRDQKGISRNH